MFKIIKAHGILVYKSNLKTKCDFHSNFIGFFYGRKTSVVTHSPLYNDKRFLKVKRVSL